VGAHETTQWFFETDAPATPDSLRRFSMTERCLDAGTTFEDMCVAFERAYAANVAGVLCECCHSHGCESCKHATGWHICDADRAALAAVLQEDQQPERRWKAGTLHAGTLDIHNSLWSLSRRLVLLDILKEKLDAYIAAGDLQPTEKDACVQVFEQMRNIHRQTNLHGGANAVQLPGTVPDDENRPLTEAELRDELRKRERIMQESISLDGTVTDQWRVYSEAIAVLGSNVKPLRLVLQASAGTGKSFLLETLFLWCHLRGHTVRAAAPTGIAAARLRLPRTPVHASTLHWLMCLSIDGESKLDGPLQP